MAAIIAGTTQAPIMSIFLFFEATQNYQIILPVMIVSIISSLITKHLLGGSLYTVKLKQHGINLYEGIEKTVMSTIQVSDIMKQKLYIFNITTPFRVVIESFLNVHHQIAFVVDDDNKLLGTISLSHMRTIIQEDEVMDILIAGDLMVDSAAHAFPDSNLSYCTELLAQGDMDVIPIVKSDTDITLIGYLTRKDILSVYNLEVMKKNLSGFKFVSKVGDGEQKKYIDLSSKYRVECITVPRYFINKTLKELDPRNNYNITILAIESTYSDGHRLPEPGTVFRRGDSLVIVGDSKAMNNFLATI
jgi:CBS domain-containing protein